jgi:hypothetical protein
MFKNFPQNFSTARRVIAIRPSLERVALGFARTQAQIKGGHFARSGAWLKKLLAVAVLGSIVAV